MIFLRFFIYGFIFSGVMLYIVTDTYTLMYSLFGGLSFMVSLLAGLILAKIYRELSS